MSVSSVNSSTSSQLQWIKTLVSALQDQSTLDSLSGKDSSSDDSWYDILDLSTQGQDAANQVYEMLASSALTKIQTSANSASATLQKKLEAALSANGVDTSEEIDLQVDSSGNAVVSNDNSQAQTIEDTINGNADLKKAVAQYTRFMQAIVPTLETANSSSLSSSSSTMAYFTQLGQELASAGNGSSSQGTVTLALQGSDFQASYLDSSNSSIVLASSELS